MAYDGLKPFSYVYYTKCHVKPIKINIYEENLSIHEMQHIIATTKIDYYILILWRVLSVVNLAVLMAFPQNTLFLLIVAFSFHVILSLLFSTFITHGHLPNMFMKTAIVTMIKNKTGGTSDKNNYRPIALVTTASIFLIISLNYCRRLFSYTWPTIWFKKKHSTDLCIFTVKSVTKYYTQENSPVFTCF